MRTVASIALILLLTVARAAAEETRARFGVQLAPENASYGEIVETFRLIEELGYDTAWLNDHFIPVTSDKENSHFESWTLLAALATQTQRVRIGILVTGNTYRHPAVLAKMATTVDHISRGRLDFGIGAGWEEFEHRAYGIPFYTAKERAERLDEALKVITLLWRADHPSFDGKYYQLRDAPFAPKPLQQPNPPIVIGGQGKKWIMPIIARYADEWNVPVGVGRKGMKERLEFVREECKRLNRAPCVREVSVFLPLANITSIPLAGDATRLGARLLYGKRISRSVLAGSPDEIKAMIQEYVDAGATSIIITTRPSLNRDLMRRFAAEIMPAFR
jgi:F420-dependent oxidoreductase-like protein